MAKPSIPRRLESTRKSWERFASEDPLWAILTDPEKRNGGWDVEEFFRSGADAIDAEMQRLSRRLPDRPTHRALDFGCGVGRLTRGLAGHFREVVGVDISARMIELADSLNDTPDRVRFVHNPSADLTVFPDNHFDLVLTLITLQHMPPRNARRYLQEFVRVTRPGGALVIQATARRIRERVLTRRLRSRFLRSIEWINRKLMIDQSPRMAMNMIPEHVVRRTLEQAGATLLEVAPDSDAGEKYLSLRYLAQKD
ncbi:MAG: methyltransferase domain-containing protein [Opitutaceae bacterium]